VTTTPRPGFTCDRAAAIAAVSWPSSGAWRAETRLTCAFASPPPKSSQVVKNPCEEFTAASARTTTSAWLRSRPSVRLAHRNLGRSQVSTVRTMAVNAAAPSNTRNQWLVGCMPTR
jgi:hypothetical protein